MANRVQVLPQIAQGSFEDVVGENMVEFEMELEEAIADAVEQFESQGIDLSNIIKRGPQGEDAQPEPIMVALEEYKQLITQDDVATEALDKIVANIVTLLKEKSVRVLLGTSGAVVVFLAACDKFEAQVKDGEPGTEANYLLALKALNALVYEQPDLLGSVQAACLAQAAASGETALPTPEILRVIAYITNHKTSAAVQEAALKTARFGCFMHESNRQAFVKAGLIDLTLDALDNHIAVESVVVQVVLLLRALTRDDDPRVPFGKANEHAKLICTEYKGLQRLLRALKACCDFTEENSNAKVAAEVFKTLSQLCQRDEFCREVVELGVLDYALPALQRYGDSEPVAHSGCSLLRAVAGNDEVKKIIGKRGGIGIIIDTMEQQLKSEKVAEQGSAAMAALCLKTPANAVAVAQNGGPHVIVKTMYMHPQAKKLQRQACMALRNCVVRNPENIDAVLGEGAENALNVCLRTHPKECADEAKAALRDLQCKVELKMLWKGEIKAGNLEIDGSQRKFGVEATS